VASTTAHRATTANLQALYPFMASPGLGTAGMYIGQEDCGDAFCFDPWRLYPHHLTNPNILIAGRLGRGKSALVKTLVSRGILFGRRAAVLDPKGEYGPLAAAFGVEPVQLRPGGAVRLNPLDADPAGGSQAAEEVLRRRLSLLQSVAAAALRAAVLGGTGSITTATAAWARWLNRSGARKAAPTSRRGRPAIQSRSHRRRWTPGPTVVDAYGSRSAPSGSRRERRSLCRDRLSPGRDIPGMPNARGRYRILVVRDPGSRASRRGRPA